MQKKRTISAELIEFGCESCNQGVYRVCGAQDGQVWPHKCNYCEHETAFATPYPVIVYKGQKFILDKHVKRPQPKPNL